MSAFTSEFSTFGGKNITVPEQHNIPAEVHTISVELPKIAYWEGKGRTKKINGREVDLDLPDVRIYLEELPEQSIRRIFEYGVGKYLADSIAGAQDAAEAQAKLHQRVHLLFSGDLTVRKANPAKRAESNPDYKIISRLFAKQLTKATEKIYGNTMPKASDKDERKKWDAAQVEALKLLAANSKVRAMVEEEKARLAALEDAEDDILGDLFNDEEDDTGEGDEESEGEEEAAEEVGE